MAKACSMVILLVSLVSGGCVSQLTQAQLSAIETREVDASMEQTFNAASSALFDAGYTISMSDRQGGLLTGGKGKDRTFDRIMWGPLIPDTTYTMSMQIQSSGFNRTSVRIKRSVNGEPQVDKKEVDQIWTLMQRQVMMKEPLASDTSQLPLPNPSSSESKALPYTSTPDGRTVGNYRP